MRFHRADISLWNGRDTLICTIFVKTNSLIMDNREQVLSTMKTAGKPVSAGEVATLSGIDRKEVDKIFAELKKDGAIVSPVRCKWEPAK